MKKKLLSILLISSSMVAYADNPSNSQTTMTDHSKMMYLDFGLGVGSASNWGQGSMAINAMTMGYYVNKNFGVEVGMDDMPDGGNTNGPAMIMTYHMAAKGILTLSEAFSLYGKAGIGVNANEGEAPSPQGMSMLNQADLGLYSALGMQFNFNKTFAIYVEGSGVAVPSIGTNNSSNNGGFGSTYMGTVGLEVRI